MEYLISYVAALVLFILIDLIWIKTVMRPIFERSIGSIMLPDPHMGAALAFFVLYQAGLLYFAVIPAVEAEAWTTAAVHGALLGIIAYGTYETTNLATIKGWTMRMAFVDVAWGSTLSALISTVAFFVLSTVS
ncbi:MAG: DUF2177 family protein [Pseudomonadota bacterium]